jgi:hypothetical protein
VVKFTDDERTMSERPKDAVLSNLVTRSLPNRS